MLPVLAKRLAKRLVKAAEAEAEQAALRERIRHEVESTLTAASKGLDLVVGFQLDLRSFLKASRKAKVAILIGCNRAAKPVRAAVISEAQAIARRGFLAASIGTKSKVYGNGNFTTVIGPKLSFSRSAPGRITRGPHKGERRKIEPWRYASVLSSPKSGTRYRGFLQRAWSAQRGAYLSSVQREIGLELEKILNH